jgi:nucleoside-diphosphate-sugar epimerase
MARVLITGATGFIGSQLTQRLVARGDEVTCLIRRTSNIEAIEPLGVRLALGDVRDAEAVRSAADRAETVYHLAGLTTAFRSSDLMQVNAAAFRNVVAACAERPAPPTLVFVSSLAAAGPSRAERPRTEDDPPAPVSHYGRTKRAAELIAQEFASRVPITIVRPPIVFGEGDLLMRPVFRPIFRYGIHMAIGVANRRYSLIHVSDLVDALILCGQRGARLVPAYNGSGGSTKGYYFVADDEQPTFAELGLLIGASLGRARVRICRTPGPVVLWSAAAASEIVARLRRQPSIFNFDKVREARAGSWTCSSATIRSELGFAPCAPLIDRLRQTADWYRQHNWL